MATIDEFRAFYARYVVAKAKSGDERLVAAFAAVERERFVGAGPWSVQTPNGYVTTGTDDPRLLYQDILIGLVAERNLNNGEPSSHALWISALDVTPGASIVHVGSGTGYYTAILAQLAGPSSSINAYEIDEDLAKRAARNLAGFACVKVQCASGAAGPLPKADVIYVNAGATRPMDAWLDALAPGGRLLFPLTPDLGLGGMLLVTRKGEREFSAKFVSRAGFIGCIGARDEAGALALAKSFERGGFECVKSLRRDMPADGSAWCIGQGWWLSTDP
jgi:protein-L-isoaspartate(D-aspartate) O-methyltransferase